MPETGPRGSGASVERVDVEQGTLPTECGQPGWTLVDEPSASSAGPCCPLPSISLLTGHALLSIRIPPKHRSYAAATLTRRDLRWRTYILASRRDPYDNQHVNTW